MFSPDPYTETRDTMGAFLSPLSGMIGTPLVLVLLLFVGCKTVEPPSPEDLRKAQHALWDAARSGDVAVLKKAINDGADVNALDARTNPNGRRALNWAAWFNHAEAIKALLKAGADIDGINITGFTPIHHAAEAGSPEAARVLIEAGADVNVPSFAGETPLQRARRGGHQEVARLLEAAGAK